jgi:hypothetical protein
MFFLFDGAERHFQQYFSNIVAETAGPGENHRPDLLVVYKK